MNSHPHQPHPRPYGTRGGGGGQNSRPRGRGRGGNNPHRPSAFAATNAIVPRHSAIHANTHVSIILKEDQPTGRQVTGLVADVLTRGDHHRGVKVRLKDGRVGRVQKVLRGVQEGSGSGDVGRQFDGTEGGSSGLQSESWGSGGHGGDRGSYRGGRGRGRGGFRPYRTAPPRGEDGNERSEATYDLTAFIRGGRRGGRGGNRGGNRGGRAGREFGGLDVARSADFGEEIPLSPLGSEEFLGNGPSNDPIARCPVCGDFEGDEAAVSHHVETHFK
ncbi:hypothetical protein TWF481_006983 [Arthrobotrys musiformis]|uniref:YwbE n=1 Tax=Arthrobotrys musiformis TaxID=47236 RepID=A0AAV9WBI1_9PEZI